jgi:hypothetical protein
MGYSFDIDATVLSLLGVPDNKVLVRVQVGCTTFEMLGYA